MSRIFPGENAAMSTSLGAVPDGYAVSPEQTIVGLII